MDKQSLSFLQMNKITYFSDILNLMCKFEIQNLWKVFLQCDYTFVASPQLIFQNQANPDYISLAYECKRREWQEKFLPFSAGLENWVQWHLFPVSGDLHAWPWWQELSPPWWLLPQDASLPRAQGEEDPPQTSALGKLHTAPPGFLVPFFSLRKGNFIKCINTEYKSKRQETIKKPVLLHFNDPGGLDSRFE